MAENWTIKQVIDLSNGAGAGSQFMSVHPLAFPGDNRAHTWEITVLDGGEAADLSGFAVANGYFMRNDGNTVVQRGTIANNVVTVVFPQAAYAVPGRMSALVRLTASGLGASMPVGAISFDVKKVVYGTVIDGGDVVPTLDAFLAEYEDMVEATAAAEAAATKAVRYDADQGLTDAQRAIGRANIHAVGFDPQGGSLYDEDDRKQACLNIRAVSYGAEMSLTAEHKATARANIGAVSEGEVSELKSALDDLNGSTELTGWVNDYYINLSGNTVDLNNPSRYENQYRYLVTDCAEGDFFTINGRGGSAPRLWGFIDASNNVLSKALSSAVGINLVLTAPANAVKLIINDNMSGGICYKGKPLPMRVNDNTADIKSVYEADAFIGKYGLGDIYCASVRDSYPNDGYYVSATGVKSGGASYHVCGLFPIAAFADYTLVYSADFVSTAYPVGAFGADGAFLGTYPATAPSETGVNNIEVSDVAALYPSAKFFAVTESAATAVLTTGAAEKGSLFPVDLSVSFAAETTSSYNSNLLGAVSLGVGRYILKWVQETDTRKNVLDSRLAPVYVNSSNVATYYHLTVENVVGDAGERYWVIDIEIAGIYRFYFWGNQLTDPVTISGINLYSVDSDIGKIYLTKAEMQNKDDTLMAFPSMFQKIGFIGDSWTAGSLYGTNGQHVMTDFNASYASQMCRIIGSTPHCFAKGGLSAREWIDDTEIGLSALKSAERQDLYWLNMGINDAGEINDGTGETGVGNPSDYDNGVTGTFCYFYGKIIAEIKEYAPNSKIVVCDILQRSLYMVKISNILPALCEYYGVPLVRMYDDIFYRSAGTSSLIVGGHPTVDMHSGMALANIRLLSKCIRNNPTYFNNFLPIMQS